MLAKTAHELHSSSADGWDILLPLAWTPDIRDRRFIVSLPKDIGKGG